MLEKLTISAAKKKSDQQPSETAELPDCEEESILVEEEIEEEKKAEDSDTRVINIEMDETIELAFRTGDEEYFTKMLYLIMSENVSPDYQVNF